MRAVDRPTSLAALARHLPAIQSRFGGRLSISNGTQSVSKRVVSPTIKTMFLELRSRSGSGAEFPACSNLAPTTPCRGCGSSRTLGAIRASLFHDASKGRIHQTCMLSGAFPVAAKGRGQDRRMWHQKRAGAVLTCMVRTVRACAVDCVSASRTRNAYHGHAAGFGGELASKSHSGAARRRRLLRDPFMRETRGGESIRHPYR